jgi:hypothetical protein
MNLNQCIDTDTFTMSCYICLEEKGTMMSQGCSCKGSISIHAICFKTLCETAANPFLCSVCKSPISPVLLAKVLGLERVMMYDENEYEEDDDEDEWEQYWQWEHGVPVSYDEAFIYFMDDKHKEIFIESEKREITDVRRHTRISQKTQIKQKTQRIHVSKYQPKRKVRTQARRFT